MKRHLAAALVACAVVFTYAQDDGRIPLATGPNVARDLQGAIDIHVHTEPDNVPRTIDGLDAAKAAKQAGMRGLVLKNHFDPTAGLAFLARKAAPGLEVFGGIDLNLPVGGMNPAAVEHMTQVTGHWGRMVWMSTFDSENGVRGRANTPFVRVSQNGQLLPETKAVIAVIAKHNLVLASGHVSAQEALLMFDEGKRQGVQHMVATHGMGPPTSLTIEQAKRAIELGAFIEFCGDTLEVAGAQAKIDRFANQIRQLGVEHVILSSDVGAAGKPLPVPGFATFIEALRKKGFTNQELDRMAKQNPATLLGLGPAAAAAGTAASSGSGSREMLYAAVGPDLIQYSVDAKDATLTKQATVTLPFAVQYVWPHPSKKFVYVAWSNGMQGDRHGVTAFRVDATGALSPHGSAIELRHRPVHLTVDANATHLLVAYNNPSTITVHDLKPDATIGAEVTQPAGLDTGIYAHQVRVDPSNKLVFLVTRGNGPSAGHAEDPGAVKVFGYDNGILTNRQSIAPNKGFGFQSRHLDFDPSHPWVFLTLEVQSQLAVFRKNAAGDGLDPKPMFIKDTLADMAHVHHPAQQAGAIHVHPSGRYVYLTNRASGTTVVEGKPVFEGGENTVAVFAIDQQTGEPSLVQRADTHGMHARTFAIDDGARLLVAANQNAVTVRKNGTDTLVPANLAVFRMDADGKLEFVRKYDIATGGGRSLMWVGFFSY